MEDVSSMFYRFEVTWPESRSDILTYINACKDHNLIRACLLLGRHGELKCLRTLFESLSISVKIAAACALAIYESDPLTQRSYLISIEDLTGQLIGAEKEIGRQGLEQAESVQLFLSREEEIESVVYAYKMYIGSSDTTVARKDSKFLEALKIFDEASYLLTTKHYDFNLLSKLLSRKIGLKPESNALALLLIVSANHRSGHWAGFAAKCCDCLGDEEAVAALQNSSPEALSTICSLLASHIASRVKIVVAIIAGRIDVMERSNILRKLVQDTDSNVRFAVARSMRSIPGDELPDIRAILMTDPVDRIRIEYNKCIKM